MAEQIQIYLSVAEETDEEEMEQYQEWEVNGTLLSMKRFERRV